MKKIKAAAAAMSLMVAISNVGLNSVIGFTASAADTSYSAEDILILPDVRPTANRTFTESSVYTVPVYMYARLVDDASMGNGALEHEATIDLHDKVATVTLKFHPMSLGDDGIYGHLEKFYYYDSAGTRTEVTDCKYDYIYDENNPANYTRYITECSFVLPSTDSDVMCRVKVDAMGDTEQDAYLVFDYNNTTNNYLPYTEAAIAEAEKITNDDGRYTSESYAALLKAIENAKNVIAEKKNSAFQLSNAKSRIIEAKRGLVEKAMILEDGYYEIPVSYFIAECSKSELWNIQQGYGYSVTDKTADVMNTIFGDKIAVKVENGVYEFSLISLVDDFSDGDDEYYIFYCQRSLQQYMSTDHLSQVTENKTKIDYFGTGKKFYFTGNGITYSMDNRYTADDLFLDLAVCGKNEKTSKIMYYGADPYSANAAGSTSLVALDIKWDDAMKTAELPTDKTALNDQIGFAEFYVKQNSLDCYTADSVSEYNTAYDTAVAVKNNESAKQSEIDEAYQNLTNAVSGLKQKVSLNGYTAELSDYIGLNYYLNISDEIKAQNPSVKFTFGEEEQTIALADVSYVDGMGYKFTVKLDAKNMTDTVKAEVYVGDENVPTIAATTKKLSVTVKDYAETIIANADNSYSAEAIDAAKAMLNYGGYSQILFDYNTGSLANASLDSTDVSTVTAETLAEYKPTKSGSDGTAKFTGYNLYLDSLTSMRFYYTGDVSASGNAENFTVGTSGNKKYVEISGITPANLMNGYDVTIGEMTIHASPASYAHTALTKSGAENLQNAMKAMILYSKAASDYDASLNK